MKHTIYTNGMYDCHLFVAFDAATADSVIEQWRQHNSGPNPAMVGGVYVANLGPAFLCPARICDEHGNTVRDIGRMVFPDSQMVEQQVAQWRSAILADAEAVALLAERSKRDGKAQSDQNPH